MKVGVPKEIKPSEYLRQASANTLVGPPVAPLIFGAPTTRVAPRAGTRPRLATFSRPQRPAGSHA